MPPYEIPPYPNADALEKQGLAEELAKTKTVAPAAAPVFDRASFAAQLEAAKQKALEIQKGVNALAEKEKAATPATSYVASSDNVVSNERTTLSRVTALNAPDAGLESLAKLRDDNLKMLEQRAKQLEERRQREIESINKQFDQTKTKTEDAQKSETGTTSVALQRVGGYLGTQMSGVGVLNNLAATHRNEIASLEAKRASAINDANNAADDKQFAIAQLKADEAKSYTSEIYKRTQDFFDNVIKAESADRANAEESRKQIEYDLEAFSLLDPAEIPADRKAMVDDYYGIPGFTDRYLKVTSAAAAAKSEKDALAVRKDLLNLLQDIPQGQKVTFPDGTEYVGMGKVSDISTYMVTDNDGVATLVSYNKATGDIGAQSVGAIGKRSGGSGSSAGGVNGVDPVTVDNIINRTQITLEANKGDGKYYDPDVYIGVREELKKNYPQLLKYTDNLFLNKANGFFDSEGIKRLRQKGIFYDAQATSAFTQTTATVNDEQIQSDDNQK